MTPTAYTFSYRIQEEKGRIWWLVIGGLVLYWLSSVLFQYLERQFGESMLTAIIGLLLVFGWPFLILKLSRTKCIVTLDEKGFSIIKNSQFNFLPKAEIIHSWAEFSYQGGGPNLGRVRSYLLSINLVDGSRFDFITSLSGKDLALVQAFHEDLEARVKNFKEKASNS